MTKKLALSALAAATLALTGCAASAPAAPVAAPVAAEAPAPASPAPGGNGASIDVDDQSGDGTTVAVREARIADGAGWVVIRTDDDGGRILGSAPLAAGATGPLTVTLTEPVPAGGDDDGDDRDEGRDLTAVLHLDDGDGRFDPALDAQVPDADDSDDDGDDDGDDRNDGEDDEFDYRVG